MSMARRTNASLVAVVAFVAVLRATSIDAADSRLCFTTTCLANGDTECDRVKSNCPTCMYAISGGFSCYDKINGDCPYPDVLTTCSIKPAVTPTVAPTPAPSPMTSFDVPATVVPPRIDTPPAPAITPLSPPSATRTPSPSDGAPATQNSHPNSMQSSPTTTKTSIDSTPAERNRAPATPSIAPPLSDTSSTKASTPASTEPMKALDSSSGLMDDSDRSSAMYINIGVIVAAVGAVALVALFIMRRVRRRQDAAFLKTPGDEDFSLQVDTRRAHGGRAHSAPSHDGGPPGIGSAAATGAAVSGTVRGGRASSTSDLPSLMSMDSITSSTAEFVQQHHPYGLPSQFGVPSEASSYMGSSSSSTSSSLHHYSNVSTSSAAFGFSQFHGSRTRPQQIDEDSDLAFYSNRKQSAAVAAVMATPVVMATVVTAAGPRRAHQPMYQEPIRRKSSAFSLASGNIYEDEYDIVRPGALRDGEYRSTETLVQDGRFQSNFSERDVRSVQATEKRFFTSRELEI